MADDPVIEPYAFEPITLTPSALTLAVGETGTLQSAGGPVKFWTTSASAIATVTASGAVGTVAGWAAGQATITAKGGPQTATARVTVTAPDAPEPPEPVAPLAPPPRVELS